MFGCGNFRRDLFADHILLPESVDGEHLFVNARTVYKK